MLDGFVLGFVVAGVLGLVAAVIASDRAKAKEYERVCRWWEQQLVDRGYGFWTVIAAVNKFQWGSRRTTL
jgi:hypothetical protein